MALRLNDVNFRADPIGMPAAHAAYFRQVAQAQQCVILSRAVGPTCRQLLEQGYDSKGFRIHGKSCDWGPMAGFVLRDPRLNKAGTGKEAYNRREHDIALRDLSGSGWSASTTPLKIYDARRVWLQQTGRIAPVQRDANRYEGTAAHPTGITLRYSLVRDRQHADVWGVYLDRELNKGKFVQERGDTVVRYDTKYGDLYEPVLAMTNPPGHRSWPGDDFRNAVTGDYDLFAIWPLAESHDPEGDDRRILGTQQGWSHRHLIENQLERYFTVSGQGTKIGNITNRIYLICQLLNSAIGGATTNAGGRNWGPFPGRMVCWHSDEAARPFVNDVDLPVLAFAPSGLEIGIETIGDFRRFVVDCMQEGFAVTLAEGWAFPPTANKPNRLGPDFANLVPRWQRDALGRPKPRTIPDWYNR